MSQMPPGAGQGEETSEPLGEEAAEQALPRKRVKRSTLALVLLVVGVAVLVIVGVTMLLGGGSGTQIAFHSERDGGYEIYVMNADGSDQTRLTKGRHDYSPAW